MKIAVAVLSAVALSAAACYGPGERNQGAEGFPAVEYRPCCDGQAAVDKAGDWGKFCPGSAGGGGGGGGGDCYGAGERNQGAAGFPQVDYKPCCDGQASVEKAGDWGKFCPGSAGGGGGGDCYGPGERNQGAAGFPQVDYKPCCDGQASVDKAGDWGKFCPGGDVDPAGVPYNPILCGGVGECGCSGAGAPQCSKCPDDGGSANVNNDVCWCSGVPGVATGNECNPLKANGPTAGGGGGGKDCYNPGERNQGAPGFPSVEYKPCCDGKGAVDKAGDWGKFCPVADTNGGNGNTGCRRRRRRRL